MKWALARSLLEQGSPCRQGRGAPQAAQGNTSSDELRRALQESLEEEQLRRCIYSAFSHTRLSPL